MARKREKGAVSIDWTGNPLCQDSAHGVNQGVVQGVVQGVNQKYAFTCEFTRVATGKWHGCDLESVKDSEKRRKSLGSTPVTFAYHPVRTWEKAWP